MGENEPLTPEKAQRAIEHYITQSARCTKAYAEACDEQAEAEADFKIKWAQKRQELRDSRDTKPPEHELDDYATIHTETELRRRLVADAKEKQLKQAARSIEDRLNATRSLAANLRPLV